MVSLMVLLVTSTKRLSLWFKESRGIFFTVLERQAVSLQLKFPMELNESLTNIEAEAITNSPMLTMAQQLERGQLKPFLVHRC